MRISPAIVVPFCSPPNFLSSTFLLPQNWRLFAGFSPRTGILAEFYVGQECANLYYFCEFPTTFGSAVASSRICFVCLS
jgi:hypothetical protein